MRFLTVRRLALAVFLPALVAVSVVPGCSNQSEGDRCGDNFGPNNDDCQDGLVCITIKSQSIPGSNTYRCCNANRSIINDSRCEDNGGGAVTPDAGDTDAAASGSGGMSSTGGTGGTGGSTDDAGSDAAGAAGAAGSN